MLIKTSFTLPFYLLMLLLLLSCKAVNSNVSQSNQTTTQMSHSLSLSYFTSVDGTKLAYRDTGGKYPPIVLLHPMTGSAEIWQKQYTALANMGFRVIGLSLRGAGRSGILPPIEHHDNQDIVALLRHLDLAKVNLVGAAAGGITALRFTIEHPKLVSSLVISNSYAGLFAEELIDLSKMFLPPNSLSPIFKELGPAYRYMALKDKASSDLANWQKIYENSRSAKLAALDNEMRRLWYAKILGSLATKDEIKTVKNPLLFIYGGADLLMPPPAGKDVQQRFENAQMVIVPKAGHAVHWEYPELFNHTVAKFLREQENL